MVERVRRLRGSGRTSRTSRYVYIFLRFQQSVLKRVEAFSAGPAQNQHKTTKPAETRRDQYKTSTKQRNWQRPGETSTKPAQNSETGRDQQRPAQNQHKTAKPAETSRDQHETSTKQRNRQRPAKTSTKQRNRQRSARGFWY
jgi:hypothetical protein